MVRKGYYSASRRKKMLQGDDINHLEVFERDNWICHLCGGKINRHLRGNSWWRATVDHVWPLSRGGTHTWGNVKAAHWKCNMMRGNDLPLAQPG